MFHLIVNSLFSGAHTKIAQLILHRMKWYFQIDNIISFKRTKIVFFLYHLLERSGEDWSQGVCCNSSGEVHHQHAEGKIRGNPSSWQLPILSKSSFRAKVAFYIFTNGRQTLGLNLTERFSITDNALENMPWPDMDVYDATKMFKSKV